MRHSLYKYFSDLKWANAFSMANSISLAVLFPRLRRDKNVRGDQNEGVAVFRPQRRLIVTNQTQGTTFTLPDHAFESAANQEEIFVFCASRSLSNELRERFEAVACVEILNIRSLCSRIEQRCPHRHVSWTTR